MFEPKTLVSKPDRELLAEPPSPKPSEKRQQRLMAGALVLLLLALGLLLYKDRDFWFPQTQEAEDLPGSAAPTATTTPGHPTAAPAIGKKAHASASKPPAKQTAVAATPAAPMGTTMQRTALPPLEVEVVAGDSHRNVHPGSNAVRVDLQPASPPPALPVGTPNVAPDTEAGVTSNAAERVQMSADTAGVISHSVKPGYPLLARQMKVQGSVILQALISRDGTIQDLHVLSGPPILASAAEEAVRQWRFKPHYQGAEAVETQARITVNFTISTN
jgi:periplasmic protein TonB